ncbi:unnamed protein product [Rotaria sordida]|uniref:Maturase K n=1 Tax=Rotaria sordida TaxID=392033 RepID=A0A819VGV6_9BILA|nr:unnamed protein product [Rotaria sordida]
MSLLLFPIIANLTQLTTLIINNIESNYIEHIVNHLSSLPLLSSLIIISIDNIKNQNDIYYKIFRLPTLKYCQLLIETLRYLKPLSIAKNEFSSIEHLVINNKASINQLNSLLSYVPQLRRLSIGYLDGYRYNRTHKSSIVLNYQIQVLRINMSIVGFYYLDYLNADQWERLISTYMPNIRTFVFKHKFRSYYQNIDRIAYKTQISKFNSLFWMKRQWFFEHQYGRQKRSNVAIFYSINPYKKYYMLYEKLEKKIWSYHFEITEHPIHDIFIHNTKAMTQFVGNFPNITELTLSKSFDVLRDSMITNLNRIIPLKQLTKLTLDCLRFSFEQL